MIKIKVLDLPPEALELEKKVEDALVNWVTTAVKSMGLPKGTKNLEVIVMEELNSTLKEGNKMKISLKELKKIISEEATLAMLEAHGLDPEDAKKVEKHLDNIKDTKDIERILKFIVKSNVKVDKTQDVTKMKKKKEKVEESNGAEVLDPAKLQGRLDSLKARLGIMERAALILAKNNKINYIIPLVKKSFDN